MFQEPRNVNVSWNRGRLLSWGGQVVQITVEQAGLPGALEPAEHTHHIR